jgi:hypothetical protein
MICKSLEKNLLKSYDPLDFGPYAYAVKINMGFTKYGILTYGNLYYDEQALATLSARNNHSHTKEYMIQKVSHHSHW